MYKDNGFSHYKKNKTLLNFLKAGNILFRCDEILF